MSSITEWLSGINVWLAVCIVDAAIGIVIYAFAQAWILFRYEWLNLIGANDPADYAEAGDFPDGENWN